ncbi:MAG: hypothetical protein ACP5HQ_02350 [Thermoprotei archaeon]
MNLDKVAIAFVVGVLLAIMLGFVTYLVADNDMVVGWVSKIKRVEIDEHGVVKAEHVSIIPGIVASANNGSAQPLASSYFILDSSPAYKVHFYTASLQGNELFVFNKEEWEGSISIGGTTIIYSKITVIYPEYDSISWRKLISEAKAVTYIIVPKGSLIDIALNVTQGTNVTAFSVLGVLQLKNYTITVYNGSKYFNLVYTAGNVDHETIVVLPTVLNDSTLFIYVIDIKP